MQNLGLIVMKDYRDLLAYIKTLDKIKSYVPEPEPIKGHNDQTGSSRTNL
jgi:hypothetical protein